MVVHVVPAGEAKLLDLPLNNCLEIRNLPVQEGALHFVQADGSVVTYKVTKPGTIEYAIVAIDIPE